MRQKPAGAVEKEMTRKRKVTLRMMSQSLEGEGTITDR